MRLKIKGQNTTFHAHDQIVRQAMGAKRAVGAFLGWLSFF